ncbi:MAG: hypothetical protein AABY07_06120 [Nanoarchaeota archaeon]
MGNTTAGKKMEVPYYLKITSFRCYQDGCKFITTTSQKFGVHKRRAHGILGRDALNAARHRSQAVNKALSIVNNDLENKQSQEDYWKIKYETVREILSIMFSKNSMLGR